MFKAPYYVVFENGTKMKFNFIFDAANHWADSNAVKVEDVNGTEIPEDILWELV